STSRTVHSEQGVGASHCGPAMFSTSRPPSRNACSRESTERWEFLFMMVPVFSPDAGRSMAGPGEQPLQARTETDLMFQRHQFFDRQVHSLGSEERADVLPVVVQRLGCSRPGCRFIRTHHG